MKRLDRVDPTQFFLSMPCSLDEKSLKAIRSELILLSDRISKIIDEAPSEKLACINIDLFKF